MPVWIPYSRHRIEALAQIGAHCMQTPRNQRSTRPMHSNDKDDHFTRNTGPPSETHKIGKTSQAQARYFETWPMVFAPTLIIQPLDSVSHTVGLLISQFFAWNSHFFKI
jgi:hypothetical protein